MDKAERSIKREAIRIAKKMILDQIRADGGKPSNYNPKEITKHAKAILEADPGIYDDAKRNINAPHKAETR